MRIDNRIDATTDKHFPYQHFRYEFVPMGFIDGLPEEYIESLPEGVMMTKLLYDMLKEGDDVFNKDEKTKIKAAFFKLIKENNGK